MMLKREQKADYIFRFLVLILATLIVWQVYGIVNPPVVPKGNLAWLKNHSVEVCEDPMFDEIVKVLKIESVEIRVVKQSVFAEYLGHNNAAGMHILREGRSEIYVIGTNYRREIVWHEVVHAWSFKNNEWLTEAETCLMTYYLMMELGYTKDAIQSLWDNMRYATDDYYYYELWKNEQNEGRIKGLVGGILCSGSEYALSA